VNRIIVVKNVQGVAVTYALKKLEVDEEYTIETDFEVQRCLTDQQFMADIVTDPVKIVINDGYRDLDWKLGIAWLNGSEIHTLDNKDIVQETPRVIGTFTYFTGQDDDISSHLAINGGQNSAFIRHSIGDPSSQSVYFNLNTIKNKTFIRDGCVTTKGCEGDRINLEVVPRLTPYAGGVNTNFNVFNGYLIIPAAGDGLIDIAAEDMVLVQMVENEFGDVPAGYWNADFDEINDTFTNITPAPAGDGSYNMFAAEVPLSRFVNDVPIVGGVSLDFHTNDISRLGHGMQIKITGTTVGDDHDWMLACKLRMYRQKTS